jgi:hypothetical protein
VRHTTSYLTQVDTEQGRGSSSLDYSLEGSLRLRVSQANKTTAIVAAQLVEPIITVHSASGVLSPTPAQELVTPFAFMLGSDCTISKFTASTFATPDAAQTIVNLLNHLQLWSPPHPDAGKWARVFTDQRGRYQALFKASAPREVTRSKIRYMALHNGQPATGVHLKSDATMRWDNQWLISVQGSERFSARKGAITHRQGYVITREPISSVPPKRPKKLIWHALTTPISETANP